MTLDMGMLAMLGVGAAVGGFVQGISGFAFGMVAMSIWVWTVDPQVAAVMTVFGGLTGQTLSALTIRRGLHWSLLWPFLAGAAIGVPLGVALLPHLDPKNFKLILGLVLLLFCPATLWAPRLPAIQRVGPWGDAAAGALGGLMGGIGGFTGVAPALWGALRGYTRDEHRTMMQNFNLVVLAATMAALVVTGAVRREMLPAMPVVAAALVVPSMIGARIYLGLSAAQFRRIVLGILSVAGLLMVVSALRAG